MRFKNLHVYLFILALNVLQAQENLSTSNDSLVINTLLKQIKENEQNNPIKSFLLADEMESYSRRHQYARGLALALKEKPGYIITGKNLIKHCLKSKMPKH